MKAGDWVIYNNYGRGIRQVAKVTPKLVKFEGDSWPRQCDRSKVVASAPDKTRAEQLKQAIDGIEGEYARRRGLASADYNARCKAARLAADKQLARLLASVDRSGEADETSTKIEGSAEGESAVTPKAADAQTSCEGPSS